MQGVIHRSLPLPLILTTTFRANAWPKVTIMVEWGLNQGFPITNSRLQLLQSIVRPLSSKWKLCSKKGKTELDSVHSSIPIMVEVLAGSLISPPIVEKCMWKEEHILLFQV